MNVVLNAKDYIIYKRLQNIKKKHQLFQNLWALRNFLMPIHVYPMFCSESGE